MMAKLFLKPARIRANSGTQKICGIPWVLGNTHIWPLSGGKDLALSRASLEAKSGLAGSGLELAFISANFGFYLGLIWSLLLLLLLLLLPPGAVGVGVGGFLFSLFFLLLFLSYPRGCRYGCLRVGSVQWFNRTRGWQYMLSASRMHVDGDRDDDCSRCCP